MPLRPQDSIKDWDSCALCLHPVQASALPCSFSPFARVPSLTDTLRLPPQDAVCTPEGVLYEKEMILECLLQQKKDIAKKLAIWQQQEQDDALAARTSPRHTPTLLARSLLLARCIITLHNPSSHTPCPQGERRKATDDQAHLAEFHRLNHGAGRYQETALAAAALAGAGGAGGGAGAAQGALAVQASGPPRTLRPSLAQRCVPSLSQSSLVAQIVARCARHQWVVVWCGRRRRVA